MSDPNKESWLRGDKAAGEEDEFARRAARGREELGSEADARELMNELDGLFAARFGGDGMGAAAGAKEAPPESREGTKVRRLGRYYAAAAAILLLVAAGSWWISRQNALNPEFIYTEAFTPYANDLSGRTMGGGEPTSVTDLDEAFLAYDRGAYGAAAESFGRYLTAPPTSEAPAIAPEKIRLYYGISLLADNQPAAAVNELEKLMNDPATGPPAAWYHALAQVRRGRLAEARTELTAIASDDDSVFRSKARDLLRIIPSARKER